MSANNGAWTISYGKFRTNTTAERANIDCNEERRSIIRDGGRIWADYQNVMSGPPPKGKGHRVNRSYGSKWPTTRP